MISLKSNQKNNRQERIYRFILSKQYNKYARDNSMSPVKLKLYKIHHSFVLYALELNVKVCEEREIEIYFTKPYIYNM